MLHPSLPHAFASDETVLFLHIPKTAGYSLSMALITQFSLDHIYHIRAEKNDMTPVFGQRHGPQREFRRLPKADKARLKLVLGHFRFGQHERMPQRCSYITVLRDPVERTISHFGQYNRDQEISFAMPKVGFEEFCQAKPVAVDNHQVRALCGWDFDKHPRDESLARAKENLQQWCRVVGVMERMDETTLALEKTFGWRLPFYRKNVGLHRPETEELGAETLARIRSANTLDTELHRFAGQLLTERIEALGRSGFAQDLEAKRRDINAWYRLLGHRIGVMTRGALESVRTKLLHLPLVSRWRRSKSA